MWKHIGEFGRKLVTIMQRVQKFEDSDNELRAELRNPNLTVDQLTEVVQRLAYELQRERENAASERRILLLEIDNRCLRFERLLPPPAPSS